MDNRKIECFAVSVNYDGTRLASGGLDGNVKVWDTGSISATLKENNEPNTESVGLSKPLKRPLCTVSRHNGAVTCVKFSPDGRYLATGSDDKIVLIWERDLQARPKQFGDTEADLEHWTVRKRLVAHDNDVQDMCWSPDGSLLVSVGLDRLIIIWSGVTFERIKRYDIHQSMVKGVVFDPANKFFATASDDRSVRIFRYYRKQSENSYEFQMEHVVMEPFRKSPLTSYFRRMTWSPDGQHIAVPNATNGPVTSVAVINRGDWGTDLSLIGHEAPCEVCSFAPRLFNTDVKNDNNSNVSTILATGGQDRTLAIWSTATSKPLVVAQNIVQDPITDMCWSPTANTLYVSSLDGAITCIVFDKNELGIVAGTDVNLSQLHRYGGDRESAILPETVEQLLLEEKATPLTDKKKVLPANNVFSGQRITPESTVATSSTPKKDLEAVSTRLNLQSQKVTTKDGKKRVAPLLVSSSNNGSTLPATTPVLSLDRKRNTRISRPNYSMPRLGVQSAIHGLRSRSNKLHEEARDFEDQDNDNEDMALGIEALTDNQTNISAASVKRQKSKMRRIVNERRYPYSLRNISLLPEVLFNNHGAMNAKVSKFVGLGFEESHQNPSGEYLTSSAIEVLDDEFFFEVVVRTFQVNRIVDGEKVQDSVTIEVRNGASWPQDDENPIEENNRVDFQDPTIVSVTSNLNLKDRLFQLYYPFKVQHVVPLVGLQETFILLASLQGTVHIISYPSGRNICAPIELAETILLVQFKNCHLMVLTCSGLLYVWKLINGKLHGVITRVSIATILNCQVTLPAITGDKRPRKSADVPQVTTLSIKCLELGEDGMPYVLLEDDSTVYKYCANLMVWTKVVEPWYFHVVNEIENVPFSTRGFLLVNGFNNFKNSIIAGSNKRYVFDESTETLQTVMKQRYQEQLDL